MSKEFFFLFSFFFFFSALFPFSASAKVSVNEIAWMGTPVSANDEWIELFNDGTEPVSLEGWSLFAEGEKKMNISLSGSIAPGSFYLLERTSDETLPGTAADIVYTGALANGGEVLILKNASGAVMEKIDARSGWPAGDNTTKDSMQFVSGVWVTAVPTPKAANFFARTGSEKDENTDKEKNEGNGNKNEKIVSAGGGNSIFSSENGVSRISGGHDLNIPLGAAAVFEGSFVPGKTAFVAPSFLWSFGDGTTSEGQSVRHFYGFPGDYTAVFSVRSGNTVFTDRITVRVFDPVLSIRIGDEKNKVFFEISNRSLHEVDLSGFRLRGRNVPPFVFPENTILPANKNIKLSPTALGLAWSGSPGEFFDLLSPVGETVSRIEAKKEEDIIFLATSTPIVNTHAVRSEKSDAFQKTKKTVHVKPASENFQAASPLAVVEITPPESLWKRIFHFFFKKKEV